MSFFGQRPSSLSPTGVPEGEVIGSFQKYQDAQKAVDYLSDQQFGVQQLSIVGHDLTSVEQVTGRLTYPRVAMLSAAQGAMFGLFFGVILAMFGGSGWGLSVLLTVLLGAAFWVIMGIISFAAQRGRRDFTSVSTFVATRYDVVARAEVAAQARQTLQGLNLPGVRHGGASSAPPQTGPLQPGAAGGPSGQHGQQSRQPHPWDAPGQTNGDQTQAGAGVAQQPRYGAPQNGGPGREGDLPHQTQRPPLGQPDLPDGRPRYGVRVDPQEQNRDAPGQSGQTGPTGHAEGPSETNPSAER